jgi:4-hydroxybenzoate polyprenyltransferase
MDVLFIFSSFIYAYTGDAVLDDDSSELSLKMAFLSFVGMIASLAEMRMYEFIPLAVGFLPAYKPFKHNLGPLKPLYVASFWTLCLQVIPTLHHGEPVDGWACSTTLGIVAAISNESDIADAPADKREGIMTVPVMYGTEAGRALTCGFLGAAAGSFLVHPTPAFLLAGGLIRGKRAGRTRTSRARGRPPHNTLGVRARCGLVP